MDSLLINHFCLVIKMNAVMVNIFVVTLLYNLHFFRTYISSNVCTAYFGPNGVGSVYPLNKVLL